MSAAQGDKSWFVQDRFGMFIHWGLYALPARHEWIKNFECLDDKHYNRYFNHFDPDLYEPSEWARRAKAAGMKYAVLTTKHHEGFCLWDSKLTDYKATNTPCGRDLVREYVDAFRAEGLKIGFYHSLIDWHHPDYSMDFLHPQRKLENAQEINKSRDAQKYTEYLHGQVRELLSDYGKIDVIWFDFSYSDREMDGFKGKGKEHWQSEKLVKMIRELQPGIIINDRLELEQDITTPEQFQPMKPIEKDGEPVVWEACQTFSGSWGYHRDEESWKSPEQLLQLLINSVSCDGNLLMNVGPNGRGEFDERAEDALQVYADWMRLHQRSIYGCGKSEFEQPLDCRYTQNGKRLYVHVLNWPFKNLVLPGMEGKVEYAQLLNDASEIPFKDFADIHLGHASNMNPIVPEGSVVLQVPIKKPKITVPVIEIFLK